MHEYSLIEALVRRVEEEARQRSAIAVHGLKVSLGELSGVEPELFRAAYEMFREGPLCRNAQLEIVRWAADWACPSCGKAIAAGEVLRCEGCDRPARLSERSQALLLDSIEMEVP